MLDLFLYGEDIFNDVKDKTKLTAIKGDIRDVALLEKEMVGCDAIKPLSRPPINPVQRKSAFQK